MRPSVSRDPDIELPSGLDQSFPIFAQQLAGLEKRESRELVLKREFRAGLDLRWHADPFKKSRSTPDPFLPCNRQPEQVQDEI